MARDINYHKVVGEPFEGWVNSQIVDRQRIYSSGFNSNRTAQQIQYLNGRSSWVKAGSGVDVASLNRLTRIGIENASPYQSSNLAKSFVLWNTITTGGNTSESALNRSGVASYNSLINNSAYGFGGTEFGIQPPPGIISFEVDHLNRGSIRKANLILKAYNKFQFDLIDTLYLRLGFSMLVEFGHSHYLNENVPTKLGNTLLDSDSFFQQPQLISSNQGSHLSILQQIRDKQEEYLGSYDALFGKVSNFTWNFSSDGTYDINIQLTSLGDVIESLKINTLPAKNQIPITSLLDDENSEEENDFKLNRDAITNWLYCLQKLEDDDKISKFNESTDLAYYHADSVPEQVPLTPSDTYFTKDWETRHYVRFGALLTWLKTEVIPYFKITDNKQYPCIDIDDFSDLRCNNIKELISFNPSVCLIKPNLNLLKSSGVGRDAYINWFSTQLEDFGVNEGAEGKILNIYLEFNFVQEVIKQNIDPQNDGKVTLFKFLSDLCVGINSSLAHTVELEPTIDEERNYIVIRDQKINPTTINPAVSSSPPLSEVIEIYGIRENSSSFVKDFNFKTEITNQLASTISIGATANGSISEDATSIQKWNAGLIDRFKLSTQDGRNTPPTEEEAPTFTCGPNQTNESVSTIKEQIGTFISRTARALLPPSVTLGTRIVNYFTERYKEQQSVFIVAETNNYFYNLALALGVGNNQNFQNYVDNIPLTTESVKRGNYFSLEYANIGGRLKSLYNTHFIREQNSLSDNPQTTNSNNIGFIPVNLSLTLDGISGFRIYNQLRVKTDLLPSNYPNVLEFIIMRVGHSIENNEWVTKIEAIAKPKSTEDAVS